MQPLNLLAILFLIVGPSVNQKPVSISAEEYFKRGVSEIERGSCRQAILDFDKAIAIDPTFGIAYVKRGFCKAMGVDLDGAIADFNKAIEVNPKLAEAYYWRGEVRKTKALRENVDAALIEPSVLADFTSAIENNPRLSEAYYARGYMFLLKDPAKAKIDFDKVIELKPNEHVAFAYYWRGQMALEQGKDAEAERDFNESLKLMPQMKEDIDELRTKVRRKVSKPLN